MKLNDIGTQQTVYSACRQENRQNRHVLYASAQAGVNIKVAIYIYINSEPFTVTSLNIIKDY